MVVNEEWGCGLRENVHVTSKLVRRERTTSRMILMMQTLMGLFSSSSKLMWAWQLTIPRKRIFPSRLPFGEQKSANAIVKEAALYQSVHVCLIVL